jgi:hypothetical protein
VSDYIFDLGKDQDGNPMPNLFGDTPVTIDSADAEISIGRFLTSMELFLAEPEEGIDGDDLYKLTALLQSLERGYYTALESNVRAADLAGAVLEGLEPSSLSDCELREVHRWFTLDECALPPASLVADEMTRRGLDGAA